MSKQEKRLWLMLGVATLVIIWLLLRGTELGQKIAQTIVNNAPIDIPDWIMPSGGSPNTYNIETSPYERANLPALDNSIHTDGGCNLCMDHEAVVQPVQQPAPIPQQIPVQVIEQYIYNPPKKTAMITSRFDNTPHVPHCSATGYCT